jgi:hypothetical protein
MNSRIRITKYLFQKCDHKKEFLIILLSHISLDRNTIIHLIGKRNNRIIYNNYIFNVSISYNSQIFNIDSVIRIYTMLSVKTMLYNLPLRVKIVQTCISIVLSSSREHTDLIIFGEKV